MAKDKNFGDFFNGKKVMITGHTGFKGSWLTHVLINFRAKIIGYSLEPNTNPSLFKELKLTKSINHYIGDVRDFENLKRVFHKEKPEIIFHLAAQPIVRISYDDPLGTIETNVIGTANVLQAIKEVGSVRSAVIITTDKVYENNEQNQPCKENDKLGGYDPYSGSKAAAEMVINSYINSYFNIKDYGNTHSVLVASARAGNVIGGGDWAQCRLVPDIIRAFFEKKERVIVRSPNAIRPWQHVLEPLRGYLLLAQKLYQGEREKSGAWNFGPNDESFLTVEKMVQTLINIFGQGEYEAIEDKTKHEANILKLDINKAKKLLGWKPWLKIGDALQLTADWYKDYYSKEDIIDVTTKQIREYFKKSI